MVPTYNREVLFVLRCLGALVRQPGPDVPPPDPDEVASLDWDWIARAAHEQAVVGFVWHLLKERGILPQVPPAAAAEMEVLAFQYAVIHSIRCQQLEEILRLFEDRRLPAMPFKGSALARGIYRDLPYRRMGDIDLFVREADRPAVCDALRSASFARPYFHMKNRWHASIFREIDMPLDSDGRESFLKPGWDLDVHVAPRYRVSGESVRIDVDPLWTRASRTAGSTAELDPADHAALLLLHAADLNDPHLAQMLDLAMITERHTISRQVLWGRLPGGLKDGTRAVLGQFMDSTDELRAGGPFSPASLEIFGLFFSRSRRIQRAADPSAPPRFRTVWSQLRGPRAKALFVAGYLLPERRYYAGCGVIEAYAQHWSGLAHRLGCVFARRPGSRQ